MTGITIDPTLVTAGSFTRELPAQFTNTPDPIFHLRQMAEAFGNYATAPASDSEDDDERLDADAILWAIDQLFALYALRGGFPGQHLPQEPGQ